MVDRPIIFSAPMVRALLDGRKTQTRRLATSPLRRCEVGDGLYVRESCYLPPASISERDMREGADTWPKIIYAADDIEGGREMAERCRWASRPSIHMPRRASRLTLIVEAVRVEPLQAISETDAIAEGIERMEDPRGVAWKSYETLPDGKPHPHASVPNASPVTSYRELWESLHGAGSWAANPDVVALAFRVVPGNIDQIEEPTL